MPKTIKIRIKPSTIQADINTKGDKAQLNIGGNVVYQPLDCSTTINENISATITSNGEYHYGYNPLTSTGLGSVDLSVNVPLDEIPLQDVSVAYTQNGEYSISPDSGYALSKVDVSVNIDTSIFYEQGREVGHQEGYNEGYTEGEEDGYNQGFPAGEQSQKDKLDSSTFTANGTYIREDGWNNVTVDVPAPTFNTQTKEVVITQNGSTTITPDASYDGLSQVDISTNIDTSTFFQEGYDHGVSDQKAKLIPLDVSANGYYHTVDGFSEVTVDVPEVPTQIKGVSYTSNGNYSVHPDTGYNLSRVDVSVNVDTDSYYDQGYADGTADQKDKLDSSTFTANGTYTREDGWNQVTVNVPSTPGGSLQAKTADASTAEIIVTPDSSFYGLSQVTVNPVTASIDSDIIPENIKRGVEILGVTGTLDSSGVEPIERPEYTPVEYIDNSLDPHMYIDLLRAPDNDLTVVLDCSFGNITGAPNSNWGAFLGVGDGTHNYMLRETNYSGNAHFFITGTQVQGESFGTDRFIYTMRNTGLTEQKMTWDSETESWVPGTENTYNFSSPRYHDWDASLNMFLFAMNDDRGNAGSPREYTSRYMRVYKVEFWMDGTLINELVPAICPDGKGGLYDTSTGTYYPANGNSNIGPIIGQFQAKAVDASTSYISVTADSSYLALSQVTVNPVTAAIDPDITPENIRQDVTILGITGTLAPGINGRLQNKEVDSSTVSQVITFDSPEYTGLETVTIHPYELTAITVDSSTGTTYYNAPLDGISQVTVNPYILDSKSVDASIVAITVISDASALSSVTVNPVTASIDPDITPENIKAGVSILGVVGTLTDTAMINLQDKVVVPQDSSIEVTADSSYDGLGKVDVAPAPLEPLVLTPSRNTKHYLPSEGNIGFSEVTMNAAPTLAGEASSSFLTQTITPAPSYVGFSSFTVTPYASVQTAVDPSVNEFAVTAEQDAPFSEVTVHAVTASIDPNIISANIVKGITILGVTGSAEVPKSTDLGYEEIYRRLHLL